MSLVRAPSGIQGELFFQKHEERAKIIGITRLPKALHPNHPPLLAVDLPSVPRMAFTVFNSYRTRPSTMPRPPDPTRTSGPGVEVSLGLHPEAADRLRGVSERR